MEEKSFCLDKAATSATATARLGTLEAWPERADEGGDPTPGRLRREQRVEKRRLAPTLRGGLQNELVKRDDRGTCGGHAGAAGRGVGIRRFQESLSIPGGRDLGTPSGDRENLPGVADRGAAARQLGCFCPLVSDEARVPRTEIHEERAKVFLVGQPEDDAAPPGSFLDRDRPGPVLKDRVSADGRRDRIGRPTLHDLHRLIGGGKGVPAGDDLP